MHVRTVIAAVALGMAIVPPTLAQQKKAEPKAKPKTKVTAKVKAKARRAPARKK